MRIELLSRVDFVRNFHQAALDYSRTPWVQIANIFGSVEIPTKTIPVLISKRIGSAENIEIFLHLQNGWKKIHDAKLKSEDRSFILDYVKKISP